MKSLCNHRTLFDFSSNEWKSTSVENKIEVLTKLLNEDKNNTLKISLEMLDYCNHEAGKEVKLMDLLISMSKIIDHLLKEDKSG